MRVFDPNCFGWFGGWFVLFPGSESIRTQYSFMLVSDVAAVTCFFPGFS